MITPRPPVGPPPPEIADIRHATGLSQVAFAERHGIPRRSVENWESGTAKCAEWLRRLLAEAEGLAPLPATIAAAVSAPRTILELRQQLGLSKADFAARHGIPYNTLTNWERPDRSSAPYILRLLSEVEAMVCASSQRPRSVGAK